MGVVRVAETRSWFSCRGIGARGEKAALPLDKWPGAQHRLGEYSSEWQRSPADDVAERVVADPVMPVDMEFVFLVSAPRVANRFRSHEGSCADLRQRVLLW